MVDSFGHTVVPMSDGDRAYWAEAGWHCEVKGCTAPAEYFCMYRYYPSRRSFRVTWTRRVRCEKHARMFAKKHDAAIEAV